MPRTAADNQRIKDERREDILAAARSVFVRKGLAAAKISDVAQAAGLSHGLVYHYFASKEAMYAELIERLFARATLDLARLGRRRGSPRARLRAFIEQRIERLRAEPDIFWLIMQAFLHPDALPASTRAAVQAFGERGRVVLTKTLREGQACGDFAAGDPVQLCTALFALLHGLAMLRPVDVDHSCVMPNVDIILRLIVSGASDAP